MDSDDHPDGQRDADEDRRPPSYEQCPRPIGGGVTWRLEDDAFVVDSVRGATRVPYRQVATVRLSYRPANVTSQQYRAKLSLSDGRTLVLTNLTWKTPVEVQRQDAAYSAFLVALLARCGRANPALACHAGQPAPLWAASMAGGAVLTLIFGSVAAWALQRGSWPLAALAVLFLLPMGWQAWSMATKNRPGMFRPDRIPQAVLPPRG